MGKIHNFVKSPLGKFIQWTALGSVAIGSAGIVQQAAEYQASRDPNADVFEIVNTEASKPTYTRGDFEADLGVKERTNAASFSWSESDTNKADESDAPILNQGPNTQSSTGFKTPPAPKRKPMPAPRTMANTFDGQGDMEIAMPASTFSQIVDSARETPKIKNKIAGALETVDERIEKETEVGGRVEGALLANARVPLPTGDNPIFYIKAPKVFNKDFYKSPLDANNWTKAMNPLDTDVGSMKEETVPLHLQYRFDHAAPNIQVDSTAYTPDKLPEPPSKDQSYVFLTAVHSSAYAEEGRMDVNGNVQVGLDLDGKATTAEIQKLQDIMKDKSSTPEQVKKASQQVLQLQQRRIKAAQTKSKIEKAPMCEDILNDVVNDQKYQVSTSVNMPTDRPIVETDHFFWLGPDKDNDGKADVYVTQALDTTGMSRVKMGRISIDSPGTNPENGMLANAAGNYVQNVVKDQAKGAIESFEGTILARIQDEVKHSAADKLPDAETLVNARFNNLLEQNNRLSTSIKRKNFEKDFNLRMTGMNVVEKDGKTYAVVRVNTGDLSRRQVQDTLVSSLKGSTQNVQEGRMLVEADGRNINEMLKDRSQGGAVDWNKMLDKLKQNPKVEDVQFNKDQNGNTVYPRIIMKDGRPVIDTDITVYLDGVGVVEGAGGIATTITGGLEDGSAAVVDNTVGKLGKPGKAVGTVVKAPFWLVNKLVGGISDAADATVGKVVDAVPKAVTGSKLSLNVNIPLDTTTENGDLQLIAQSKGVKLQKSNFKSEGSPIDIIPTRLVISEIAQCIAEDNPGMAFDEDNPVLTQELSLKDKGVDFKGVSFEPGSRDKYGDTVPNLQAELEPNENFQSTVSRLIDQ